MFYMFEHNVSETWGSVARCFFYYVLNWKTFIKNVLLINVRFIFSTFFTG